MDNQGTQELHMERNIRDLLNLYNPNDPLDHAWTIPSPWYFDAGIHELEQRRSHLRERMYEVFASN